MAPHIIKSYLEGDQEVLETSDREGRSSWEPRSQMKDLKMVNLRKKSIDRFWGLKDSQKHLFNS